MGFLEKHLFHKHEHKMEGEGEDEGESSISDRVPPAAAVAAVVERIDPGAVVDESVIVAQHAVVLEGKVDPENRTERFLLHEIPDGPKKLKENNFMKEVGKLNEVTGKAITSIATVFRTVETVKKGSIPLSAVVETVVDAVNDFKILTVELDSFRKEGTLTLDDINHYFDELLRDCHALAKQIQDNEPQDKLLLFLDEVANKLEFFLQVVNDHLKKLQSLRVRTAQTWLASTGIASITVGTAAAALCVLSGGTTLPVLAPVFAFGAGSTAVATASHIAFNPSLGSQIRGLDSQISELHTLKEQAGIVSRKVESKSNEIKRHKWKFWN